MKETILVTGSTGYIGGRLINPLLDAGYNIKVLTRNASHLTGRSWLDQVDVVEGDVLDADSLAIAMQNVDVAYYLVHSMSDNEKFVERDNQAAENFARIATDADVKQIIYLGGLGHQQDNLSDHLSSRQQVGKILREHHGGVTEFRAAMVVGAGSLSFEIVRHLTERLPLMIAPSWLYTASQPIAIKDVLAYLVSAIGREDVYSKIIEIGGQDVMTYRDMILTYGKARRLTRLMIPIPLVTPILSSYWVHMVTPVSATIIRAMINSLQNEMIVTDDSAQTFFPNIKPRDYTTAISDALYELDAEQVETTWADSMSATWETDEPYTFVEERGMLIENRMREVDIPEKFVYQAFTSLGGTTGWLYLNFLWHIRGWMDRVVGGPGYRRGRPARKNLRIGDALDFWRVEAIEPNHRLLLRAEMKLPGKGWLQYKVEPTDDGKTRLTQTAYFAPSGLFGYIYWYSIFVLHKLLFSGLIDRIIEQANILRKQQNSDSSIQSTATTVTT